MFGWLKKLVRKSDTQRDAIGVVTGGTPIEFASTEDIANELFARREQIQFVLVIFDPHDESITTNFWGSEHSCKAMLSRARYVTKKQIAEQGGEGSCK